MKWASPLLRALFCNKNIAPALGLTLSLLPAAHADVELQTLLNLDHNQTTGCSITTVAGAFAGAEQVVTTTLSTTSPPQVTGVSRQKCVNGALQPDPSFVATPPQIWPVGLGNGTGGFSVVETYAPMDGQKVPPITLGFTSRITSGGSGEDAVLTRDGTPSAPPIQAVMPGIPLGGAPALALLTLLLTFAAMRTVRRNRFGSGGLAVVAFLAVGIGLVWAATVRDGQVGDWAGVPVLATDPVGDAPPNADIVAIFARDEGATLQLRIDINIAPQTVPVATNDAPAANSTPGTAYHTAVDTAINSAAAPAYGVLDNDTGTAPLAVASFGPATGTETAVGGSGATAQGGTITVTADGRFNYTPPAGFVGLDSFKYVVSNVAGTATGTVTIAVGARAVGAADSYPVTAGGTNTIAAGTGLLANDTGSPVLTVSSVNGNAANVGTPIAVGGGTLTVNADGSFVFVAPAAPTTVSFTYTAHNALGDSAATTVSLGVQAAPVATADAPTAASAPGNAWHTAVDTAINSATAVPAYGVLDNDLGAAPLAVTSFGPASGSETTVASGSNGATSAGGTIKVLANGRFTYTPAAGFVGFDTFKYVIGNAVGVATGTATIAVGVRPAAANDSYGAMTGATLNIAAAGLLSNDSGSAPLTVSTVNGSAANVGSGIAVGGGTLTVNADGSFSFVAPAIAATATFTYTAHNALGDSAAATVTLQIQSAPVATADAPAASSIANDPFHTAVDTALNSATATPAYGVLDNDTGTALAVVSFGPTSGAETTVAGGSNGATSAGGTVKVLANGRFTYTPASGFVGFDTFKYVAGNIVGTATGTVTIAVGVRPGAANDSYAVPVSGNLNIAATGLLGNDTGSATLTVSTVNGSAANVGAAVVLAGGGTVTVNANGSFTYAAPAIVGTATFTYTAHNALGDSASATVTIETMTAPAATADAPAATSVAGDAFHAAINGSINSATAVPAYGVLDNDTGGGLAVASFGPTVGNETVAGGSGTTTGGGTLSVAANGRFTYTPANNFNGYDSFKYVVSNAVGSATGTVTIAVGVRAVANADSYAVASAGTLNIAAAGLLGNDIGSGTLTVVSVNGNPANVGATLTVGGGALTVAANGSFTYLAPVAVGPVTFTYVANGSLGDSASATVTIDVLTAPGATNDAPAGSSAAGDAYHTSVNGTINSATALPAYGVLDNDTGGGLAVASFGPTVGNETVAGGSGTTTGGGTLSVAANGRFTYTPANNFNGYDSFKYVVSNAVGNATGTVTIAVGVRAVANADNYAVANSGSLNIAAAGLLGNDTGSGTLTVASVNGVAGNVGATLTVGGGTLTVAANGGFTYLAPVVDGPVTFTYTAHGSLGDSASATVTINVQTAPSAGDDAPAGTSVAGDAYHTAVDTLLNSATAGVPYTVLDNDTGSALAVVSYGPTTGAETGVGVNGASANGGVVTLNAAGQLLYTPASGFVGLDTFKYVVGNSVGTATGTVTIAVGVRAASVTDGPAANSVAGDAYHTTVDTPLDSTGVYNVIGNDAGSPTLTVTHFGPVIGNETAANSAGSSAQSGTLLVKANGEIQYTPAAGYVGIDTFKYTLSNPLGTSVGSVSIAVGVRPAAVDNSYTVGTGGTLAIAAAGLLGNDTGSATLAVGTVNGSAANVGSAITPSGGGTLTVAADGGFNYVAGPAGTVTFTYTASNPLGGSSAATVTINVVTPPTAFNDAPANGSTAPGAAYHVAKDGTITSSSGPYSVLDNDTGTGPLAVTTFGQSVGTETAAGATGRSLNGTGNLLVASNGQFNYAAPAGFTGYDTFKYVVTNIGGSSTGTVTIAVGTRPAATNDSFDVAGNIGITLGAVAGVLANDTGDSVAVASYGPVGTPTNTAAGSNYTTANGGVVNIAADGSLTFTPGPGFSGNDTIAYRLSNALGTADGTITFVVTAADLWFVDSSVATSGNGTFGAPFKTLADLAAVNNGTAGHPKANEYLFVLNSTGTATYSGSLTLLSGQQLIGQGSDIGGIITTLRGGTLPTGTPTLPAAGTKPVIYNAAGTTVTLNTGNTLRGLDVGAVGNVAHTGISGAAVGAFTVSDNVSVTASTGPALSLNGSGTVNAAFQNITSTGSTTYGISLTSVSGTVTASGGTITNATTAGVYMNGGNGSLTYGGNVSTNTGRPVDVGSKTGGTVTLSGTVGSTANGINLANNASTTINLSGALTLNTGANTAFAITGGGTVNASNVGSTITTAAGTGFSIDGGADNVTYAGTATVGAGRLLSIINKTAGTVNLTGALTSNGGTGTGVNLASNGTSTINISGGLSLNTGTNAAFTVTGNGAGTVNVCNTNPCGGGTAVTNSVTTSTGTGFAVSGGAENINFPGTITTSSTGRPVSIASKTGGTVVFTGGVSGNSGTSLGVSLTSNTGATIRFAGGLVLSTGTNAAFTATGGGTVEVCDDNPCNPATGALVNTITSGTGAAVTITSTTIGANGVAFRSINTSGATKGIVLNTTGAGPFTVTGTGTTDGTGGTVQNTAQRGAEFIGVQNLTLKNMNFTNPTSADLVDIPGGSSTCGALLGGGSNSGCGAAIHIETASNVTLDNLNLSGSGSEQNGLNVKDTTGMTLANLVVEGFADEANEYGVNLKNVHGTVTISGSEFRNNTAGTAQFGVENNTAGGSPLVMSVSTSNFTTVSKQGGQRMAFLGYGTANMSLTVTGGTFSGADATSVLTIAEDSATMAVNVSGATVNNSNVGIRPHSLETAAVTGSVTTSSLRDFIATAALHFYQGSPSSGTSSFTFDGNTIGIDNSVNPGANATGCFTCDGVDIDALGNGTLTANVTNNIIREVDSDAIWAGGTQGQPVLNVNITGNTISLPKGSPVNSAIFVLSGAVSPGDENTWVCAAITGNTISGNWATNGGNIVTRNRWGDVGGADTWFRVAGFTTGPFGTDVDNRANVQTYLGSQNGGTSVLSTLAAGPANTYLGSTTTTCPAAPANWQPASNPAP